MNMNKWHIRHITERRLDGPPGLLLQTCISLIALTIKSCSCKTRKVE